MSAAIKLARARYQGDRGYARAMPGTGYAGDPGLFGSIFGGLKKGFGLAAKFIPGGAAVQTGISLIRQRFARRNPRQIGTRRGRAELNIQMAQMTGPQTVPVLGPSTIRERLQNIIPGGATGLTVQIPGEAIGARVPQGYHLNKTGYWRGAGGMNPEYIPKESIFVKNRKRNPLNPRAWDRAFGRLKSAQNFKRKMGRITIKDVC